VSVITTHPSAESAPRRRLHAATVSIRLATLARPFHRSVSSLWRRARVSTFEKAILANSVIILLDTIAGWWITQHNPEAYHYVIDTSFIALAAVVGVIVNFALLRAAFAPLRAVLTTIRRVEDGEVEARVAEGSSDADAQTLAHAFNAMLDRLALARDEMVARELRAQEAERRRLALELHDQMGQSLTALTLHAQVIAQRLAGEPGETAAQARAQTERLIALAERTLAEAQALSRQLRPAILDDLGLAAALRWLADDAQTRLGVSVQTRIRDERLAVGEDEGAETQGDPAREDDVAAGEGTGTGRLPDDIETTLFRIAQESLTNAVRHGQARRARIHLRLTPSAITLTIGDDGCGFDPALRGQLTEPVAKIGGRAEGADRQGSLLAQPGIGLAGMRERARLIGGALAMRSQPGQGCVVRVAVALPLMVVALP